MMTTKWFRWLVICPSDGSADNRPDSSSQGNVGGQERARRRSRCGCLQCKKRRRRRSRGKDGKHHGRKRLEDDCGCDCCSARETSRVSPGSEKPGSSLQRQNNEGAPAGGGRREVEELRRRLSSEITGRAERDTYHEESGLGRNEGDNNTKSPEEDQEYPEVFEKSRQTENPYGRQFALSLEELRSVKLRKVRRPSMEAIAAKHASELETVGTGGKRDAGGGSCGPAKVSLLSPVHGGDEEDMVTSVDEDMSWKYLPRGSAGSSDFGMTAERLAHGSGSERVASPMATLMREGGEMAIRVADGGSEVHAVGNKNAHRVSPHGLIAWDKVSAWMERESDVPGDSSIGYLSGDDDVVGSGSRRSRDSTRVEVLDEGVNGSSSIGNEERGVSPQPADLGAFGRMECALGLSQSGLEAWNKVLTWMNRERRLSINELFLEPEKYQDKVEDGVHSTASGTTKMEHSTGQDAELGVDHVGSGEKVSGTLSTVLGKDAFGLDTEQEWDEADGTPARSVLRAQQALSEIEKMLRDRGTCSNEGGVDWMKDGRGRKPLRELEENESATFQESEPENSSRKDTGSSIVSSGRGWGMAILRRNLKGEEEEGEEKEQNSGGPAAESHTLHLASVKDGSGKCMGERYVRYERDTGTTTTEEKHSANVNESTWCSHGGGGAEVCKVDNSSLQDKEGTEQESWDERGRSVRSKEGNPSKERQGGVSSGYRSELSNESNVVEERTWSGGGGLGSKGRGLGQSLSARIEKEFSARLEESWRRGSQSLQEEGSYCPSQSEKGSKGSSISEKDSSASVAAQTYDWFDRDEVEHGLTGFEAELVKAVKAWDRRRLLDTPQRVHVPKQLESGTTGEEKGAERTKNEGAESKETLCKPSLGGDGVGFKEEQEGIPQLADKLGRHGGGYEPWTWDGTKQRKCDPSVVPAGDPTRNELWASVLIQSAWRGYLELGFRGASLGDTAACTASLSISWGLLR